ncbi:MAG: alpha/beta hydrolase [Myxococcales bacterium]|nr:alpha/beta hydrolase [Myxococcales bacterium]
MDPSTQFIDMLAKGLACPQRTPIQRTPDEIGLDYEDITFETEDGVTLRGWFIPTESERLVICNHFGPANRQGYPGHLEGFPASNGVNVDFLPKYKALHDAGYNVLCYDLRGHGESDADPRGFSGVGLLEWQDVLASLAYAKSRPDTAAMEVHLQSMCLGCNSTLVAMRKNPVAFAPVRSFVAIHPVIGRSLIDLSCQLMGISDGAAKFEPIFHGLTGFHVDEYDMVPYAADVRIPTLVVQVKDDPITRIGDIEALFERLPNPDKQLFWIEGTPVRHDGYAYFSEHPERMLAWHDAHREVAA